MRCGVWVDHRQAILVKLEGSDVTLQTVRSDVPPRTRRAGGSTGMTAAASARARPGRRAAGPQQALAEDRLDRRYEQALRDFYERVVDTLRDARSIHLMGPGEAPGELLRWLGRDPNLRSRVIGVEAADKMTRPQLVARVREVYGRQLPRVPGRAGTTG